jgi:hypothetical protein
LYLHDENDVFNVKFDKLGLICIPQPDPPRTAIYNLLRKAQNQLSTQLPSRLQEKGYASDKERSLFNSFACPENLAGKHGITDENIGDLLQRVLILEHDFEYSESKDEAVVIFLCQHLLVNDTSEEGKKLWQAIGEIAQ